MKRKADNAILLDQSDYNKKNKYKKENHPTTRQWSNLPQDLLNLIISKLYFTDRIRFRAVCKHWHIPIGARPINELPWAMTLTWFKFYTSYEKTKVTLLDPVHKKTRTIPNLGVIGGEYLNCFDGSRICASKGGWLLLVNCKPNSESAQFFLCSPFNNDVIMLPTLFNSFPAPDYTLATFSSSNPTSPNCIFVVTHKCVDQYRFAISTYCNGDNQWRTKILNEDFEPPINILVCTVRGFCYIVLGCGKLGAFCVESQELSWLVDSCWSPENDMHLVEFNGNLLLAKGCFEYDTYKVFIYDGNKKRWIKQKSLGDKVLFIDPWSSYLRPAIGDTTNLAGKIFCNNYNHNRDVCETRVYTLKNGKRYRKSRAYDWKVKDSREKIWIEPLY